MRYGSTGTRIDKKEFLPHWLQGAARGSRRRRSRSSASRPRRRATAACCVPDPEVEGFGFTDYGYHLPAIPYGAWLKPAGAASRSAVPRGASAWTCAGDADGDIAGAAARWRAPGRRAISSWTSPGAKPAASATALGVRAARAGARRSPPTACCSPSAHRCPPAPIYSEVRAHAPRLGGAAGEPGLHPRAAGVFAATSMPVPAALDAAAARMALRSAWSFASAASGRSIRPARLPGRITAWRSEKPPACSIPSHFVDLHAVQVGLVHLLPLFPVQRGLRRRTRRVQPERARRVRTHARFPEAHYLLNRYGQSAFWERPARRGRSPSSRTRSTRFARAAKSSTTKTRPSRSTTGSRCSSGTACCRRPTIRPWTAPRRT